MLPAMFGIRLFIGSSASGEASEPLCHRGSRARPAGAGMNQADCHAAGAPIRHRIPHRSAPTGAYPQHEAHPALPPRVRRYPVAVMTASLPTRPDNSRNSYVRFRGRRRHRCRGHRRNNPRRTPAAHSRRQIGSTPRCKDHVHDQIAPVRGQIVTVRGQIAAMRGQIAHMNSQIDIVRGQIVMWRGQIVAMRGHTTSMRRQLVPTPAQLPSLRGHMAASGGPTTTSAWSRRSNARTYGCAPWSDAFNAWSDHNNPRSGDDHARARDNIAWAADNNARSHGSNARSDGFTARSDDCCAR